MEMVEILELERKNNEQKAEWAIKQARYENQQEMINTAVFIIGKQMEINNMALFSGLLGSKEDK